jgi:hypothetical protein
MYPSPVRVMAMAVLPFILASIPNTAFACTGCACTPDVTGGGRGLTAGTQWTLGLRSDYPNRPQLYLGMTTARRGVANTVGPACGLQAVDRVAEERRYTTDVDYSASPAWGVSLQLPFVVHHRETPGATLDGYGLAGSDQYERTSTVGDARLVGRYHGFSSRHNVGILFGLKLPGSYTPDALADPNGNTAIERSLHPETGTTDAIVGGYYFNDLNKHWSYFVQSTYQSALDSSSNHYRPGNGLNVDLGLRYRGFEKIRPQLQLNSRHAFRDSGTTTDTGGTLVYLSPGLMVPVGKQTSIFGFVRLPIHRTMSNDRLAPGYSCSLGVHRSF